MCRKLYPNVLDQEAIVHLRAARVPIFQHSLVEMSLRFLCTLAVLEIFGFNFNVFAEEHLCRAVSVKDTCAEKVADLKQPEKLMAQLLWGMGAVDFHPHENTKKALLGETNNMDIINKMEKTKPKYDPNYKPIPVELGPLVLTCANDRDVFPNTCSGYRPIEVFTVKKALQQAQSEQMVHERALGDMGDMGDMGDPLDPLEYLRKYRDQEAQELKDKGFSSEILTYGMAWYFFSEYDAETNVTKDVMKGVFSIGGGAGLCEKDYKINGTGCFGMQETSRPAVDPPKPPALPDSVHPQLPELKAKKPPGSDSGSSGGGGGVIIAIVVVILLLIGAGGFLYVRQKKIDAAHGAREVELS